MWRVSVKGECGGWSFHNIFCACLCQIKFDSVH